MSTTASGRLVVLSGPGGVGKGTLVTRVREEHPEVSVSVSATTRSPRPGEVDGRHYHFVDAATFDRMIADGAFLEWAEFGGNRYGTPWSSVRRPLADGATLLLEIEIQGALQVRERQPGAVLVFLAPPDEATLVARLRERGTDDEERIAERLELARWELAQRDRFDHVVVNDDLSSAAERVARILLD